MQLGAILEQRLVSIEEKESNNITPDTSIELPEAINSLITGNEYWRRAKANRYRKLIRDGFLHDLLKLAEIANTKDNPAHWFATVASKAQWERTLEFLAKLREVANNAAEVVKRLDLRPEQIKAVYAACWRFGNAVIKKAVTAQETGRDKFKYFNWLCRREAYERSTKYQQAV